jgi:ribosomal-protein-alanine N-acetyltransferase
MIFRTYTPDDFDALYALEERCFDPTFRFPRPTLRSLVRRPNSATWIAEDDESVAGFAIIHWNKKEPGTPAYIQTIEVDPDARNRGVGGELLRRIEQAAREAGATLIWLHVDAKNADAVRLYERRGFCLNGREEDFYPMGRAALIYIKELVGKPAK